VCYGRVATLLKGAISINWFSAAEGAIFDQDLRIFAANPILSFGDRLVDPGIEWKTTIVVCVLFRYGAILPKVNPAVVAAKQKVRGDVKERKQHEQTNDAPSPTTHTAQ